MTSLGFMFFAICIAAWPFSVTAWSEAKVVLGVTLGRHYK
uniref:Uncharacterized protein n=1 Tax=Anguilla anguilla TaxID=7936 RepID=A0A0E9U157_ANGAN